MSRNLYKSTYFYAKQTQFPRHPNGYKLLCDKDLCKFCPPETSGKQTQFKPKQTQSAGGQKLMQSLYVQRIMTKNAAKGDEKTKPKQTQFKANLGDAQNERNRLFYNELRK